MVRATHKTLNAHRCDFRSLKCLRNSAAFQGLMSEPSSMVTGFEVLLSAGTFPKTVATSASTFFMYAAFSRASTLVTVESEECDSDAGSMSMSSRTSVLVPAGAGESQTLDDSIGVTVASPFPLTTVVLARFLCEVGVLSSCDVFILCTRVSEGFEWKIATECPY